MGSVSPPCLFLCGDPPGRSGHPLTDAGQLLIGLDLRATTLTTRVAALVRDAGRGVAYIEDRAQVLRADIPAAGVTCAERTLDPHSPSTAVRGDRQGAGEHPPRLVHLLRACPLGPEAGRTLQDSGRRRPRSARR